MNSTEKILGLKRQVRTLDKKVKQLTHQLRDAYNMIKQRDFDIADMSFWLPERYYGLPVTEPKPEQPVITEPVTIIQVPEQEKETHV